MGTKKKEGGSKPRTGLTLGNEMIEILVGPDKVKFLMHKDRVCELSGYFRGLLKGNFKDANEGTTTLTEENVDGFKLFQHCVYNNSFPEDFTDIDGVTGSDNDNENENITQVIVAFYVLADQLILENRFKIQAIRAFMRSILPDGIPGGTRCGRELTASEVNSGLTLLPDNDPFLKLLLDLTAYQYLKRNAKAGLYIYELGFTARKKAVDRWLEECIADVPLSRITMLFAAMAEFTKGWNNSRHEAGMLNKAFVKGVEATERYAVGFLTTEASLEELAALDEGDEHVVKKAKVDDGE